jgi:phosphoserine phosphatase
VAELQTVLLRLNGPDHPGINAGLMLVLDAAGASVQDIEQIVIRGQISLSLVVDVPEGRDLLKEILLFGWEHRLQVDFEPVPSTPSAILPAFAVTIVGQSLTPLEIGAAASAVADAGANIDRIVRLARYPVMSYEFLVRDGDEGKLRANLLGAAALHPGLDVAIQKEGLRRRAKRLVVIDVDSTLIRDEAIDLLAAEAGTHDEVTRITFEAMEGTLDFETALRERVRLLAGLDEAAIARAVGNLRLTPGARTFMRTLHRLGYTTAIVSGGFTPFTDHLRDLLHIHHAHANQLEMVDGLTTGELSGPVVDRARKAELLVQIAAADRVPLDQVVAVGDGANDLDMLSVAGLGIAFNARSVVEEAADTSVTVPYLDAVLFILGVRREEIDAADLADETA